MQTAHTRKHRASTADIDCGPGGDDRRSGRAAWLNRDKFGMFIHWGLYSGLARGEWVMQREKIPVAKYAKLAETFNPVEFDADAWVAVARKAGIKYMTVTAKHHDGFCMFDTAVDSYNIVAGTPFQRDVIGELKQSCDAAGIRFGIYYSHAQDWYHPGATCHGPKWDDAQAGDFRTYLDTVAIPQITELLTRYEPTHLWFDTPIGMSPEVGRELVNLVRSIKPDTLVNSRLMCQGYEVASLSESQLDELERIGVDFLSYRDRAIPDQSPWEHWETCMTLNESWGFEAGDHRWKPPERVIAQLVEVVSKGGAFLLNMAPTGDGRMLAGGVDILAKVGDWLEINGEAIYGAAASPLKGAANPRPKSAAQPANAGQPAGATRELVDADAETALEHPWLATASGGTLYIHLLEWPAEALVIEGLPGAVTSARWLSDPQQTPPAYSQEPHALTIRLPGEAPAELVPVLALEIDQEGAARSQPAWGGVE